MYRERDGFGRPSLAFSSGRSVDVFILSCISSDTHQNEGEVAVAALSCGDRPGPGPTRHLMRYDER
jgi:hypothetical protein